jgi:hypothetical protein
MPTKETEPTLSSASGIEPTTFLTALFAQLRVLGIEPAVVITSMEHCSKVLGCCQHDMEMMLNNAGLD